MKRVSKNIWLFIILCSFFTIDAQKKFSSSGDIFGLRVFVENNGQFDNKLQSDLKVRFAYETAQEHIYFTDKGPVYKLIRHYPMKERELERMERGKNVRYKEDKVRYVKVNWIGCNTDLKIVEEEVQNHYFTYGDRRFNSRTFRKITYKNVYDGIDIEYVIDQKTQHGIKYNVVVHPGADPELIRISYEGDVNRVMLRDEKILVKTDLEDIVEHAPLSYQESNSVRCGFKLNKNEFSFSFPNGIDRTKKLVIDPFVTSITSLLSSNYAFDVDYDAAGNLFVYGGINQIKVAKYDPQGNLLWTFAGIVPGISWFSQGVGNEYIGNFLVDKITGKVYLGQGFEPANGPRVIRLDATGVYDNFVTPILYTIEVWDFAFHCPKAKVYQIGGGTITNLSGGIVNPNTATVNMANFTGLGGAGHDVVSSALDADDNLFVLFASGGTPVVSNKILRVNNTFNGNLWMQPSTYSTFSEATNKQAYIGGVFQSNGFNALAVNDNYLFYYDGFNLAAYNKTNGQKLAFIVLPMNDPMQQGGIAVDECNNVYVGGIGQVNCFNFNGVTFNSLSSISLGAQTPNQYVYDIKLAHNTKLLYVCGSGFAGVYSAIHSLGCGTVSPFAVNASCSGFNNGQAVATLTAAIPNPTINYIWLGTGGGTVSATLNSTLTTNSVSLPNGTYTLQTHLNSPCGPVYNQTFNVVCCTGLSVTPQVTQITCTNALNSATIQVSGGGTVTPSYSWSPPPGTVIPGSASAASLSAGINSVVISHGAGCVTTTTFNVLPPPPPVSFTLNSSSGNYSITCQNPAISLQALSSYTYGALSYTWNSLPINSNAASVTINVPVTMTISVSDPFTGCMQTQTVSVGVNTVSPNTTVTPLSQVITCNSGVPVTFTALAFSPTVNLQHDWYSPINPLPNGVPIATSNNSISILSGNNAPGIYTLQTTDLVNGCKTVKTITITSLDAWPSFSLASSTNFSLGCNPLHQTTLSIINPVSTQTPPSVCSFTFLAPSFTGAVTPSVVLGTNTSTLITTPGTWTVIVQDNSNFCRTQLAVPIIQNTVAPNVSASMFTQTLTCKHPTVLASGTSTTPNTIISWNVPSTPPQLSTSTVVVGVLQNGPPTSTTSLSYANFTVVATNTLNACQNTSVVTISQNFRPPVSSPTISIGTPTAIYCTSGNAPVVLTTGSSTITSNGMAPAFPVVVLWQGPSPQQTVTGASSYSCYVPGVYSLTIEDSYNGCRHTGTINVLDRTQPPVITAPSVSVSLDCGAESVLLQTEIIGGSNHLKFWYYAFPFGAAFSPTNAIQVNGSGNILNGTSSSAVSVSHPGEYAYAVTNTITGCKAYGVFKVDNGQLQAEIDPDNESGFAPLTVNFTNRSITASGSPAAQSVWSFGNGLSAITNGNNGTSTVYEAPGTYTVKLIGQKGNCIDTAYSVIKVELPSRIETPNVFTPNGDGSNDVFILHTAGIAELNVAVFDRWGNKVYELKGASENMNWDGTDLYNRKCASGVYFYVIEGKGKDGKEYKKTGNITLFR